MATTTKPKRAPSFPHWLVLSPITSAVKMMISVEGAEKWKVLEHARYVVMLIVWLALWIIRLLLVNFPTLLPPSGILESIATTTSPSQDNITCQTPCSPPSCSIGRALSQVLGLVNDTPVTSRKYEFVRNLADKMIEENWKYGCPALEEVTRMALSAGFGRTLKMLDSCLRQQQQDEETSGWGWKLIRRIPLKGIPLYSRVENIGGGLSNLLQMQMQPPPAPAGSLTLLGSQPPVAPVGTETMMAEKLAKELMWIADKLAMCSAVEVAILQWSSASSLANLSISANPRVQGSLVRVSGITRFYFPFMPRLNIINFRCLRVVFCSVSVHRAGEVRGRGDGGAGEGENAGLVVACLLVCDEWG
eukprot:Gb_41373 [translate_table: standard]